MKQIRHALLEETYYRGKVGELTVYFVPKKGFLKKYAILGVPYGSNGLTFQSNGTKESVQEGIAHFLEHILFEGEEGNAFTLFPSLGASSNAYTSHTQTAYLFSCTENFYKSLNLLLNFVHTPYFSEQAVQKEKGVIGEEIDMGEDSAGWKLYSNLLEALFVHHPIRKDIAGTRDSVNSIQAKDLYLVHQTFYNPSNMALIIVGDLELKDIQENLKNFYENKTFFSNKPSILYPKEPKNVLKKEIQDSMDIAYPYLLMGYKNIPETILSPNEIIRKELAISFALEILFSKTNSFIQDLYDEHLIDNDFSASHTQEAQYGYTMIGGETKNPEKLTEAILKILKKGSSQKLDREHFRRIKNKSLGQFLCSMDSVGFVANEFLDHAFRDFCPYEYLELVENMKIGSVEETLQKYFEEDCFSRSLILPISRK